MRPLVTILALAILSVALSFADEPTTKDDMIHAADCIAVVEVSSIDPPVARRSPPPPEAHTVNNVMIGQRLIASVHQTIKGSLPQQITISYSVSPYSDDPDDLFLTPGRYLVFLARHGDGDSLTFLTRHAHWSITDSQVNWFGKKFSAAEVIQDIKAHEK